MQFLESRQVVLSTIVIRQRLASQHCGPSTMVNFQAICRLVKDASSAVAFLTCCVLATPQCKYPLGHHWSLHAPAKTQMQTVCEVCQETGLSHTTVGGSFRVFRRAVCSFMSWYSDKMVLGGPNRWFWWMRPSSRVAHTIEEVFKEGSRRGTPLSSLQPWKCQ